MVVKVMIIFLFRIVFSKVTLKLNCPKQDVVSPIHLPLIVGLGYLKNTVTMVTPQCTVKTTPPLPLLTFDFTDSVILRRITTLAHFGKRPELIVTVLKQSLR